MGEAPDMNSNGFLRAADFQILNLSRFGSHKLRISVTTTIVKYT